LTVNTFLYFLKYSYQIWHLTIFGGESMEGRCGHTV